MRSRVGHIGNMTPNSEIRDGITFLRDYMSTAVESEILAVWVGDCMLHAGLYFGHHGTASHHDVEYAVQNLDFVYRSGYLGSM